MIFNSYSFILVFLPIAFIGFFLLSKVNKSYGITWLGFISIFFIVIGVYIPCLFY